MPAVKKSLDVYLQQGLKSRFNKAEREDTIRSVCRMNRVVFHISEIVEEDIDISLWPCVDLGKYKVDPLRDVRVTQTIGKEDPEYFPLKTWPFFQEGEEAMMLKDWFTTANTKGQLIIVVTAWESECALLKVFDRIGNLLQSLHLKLPLTKRNYFCSPRPVIRDIASDRANNVFLLVMRFVSAYRSKITVIVFDQHANFQHEFDVKEGSFGSRIAVSDDKKVFVSAKMGEKRWCVQVYNFYGVLLNSFEDNTLETVIDMTLIDSQGSGIMVLGIARLGLLTLRRIYQFSEQGNVPSRYYDVSDCVSHIRFLHKTEHVVMLQFHWDGIFLCNKNGEFVRGINLKPSALGDFYAINAKTLTVTAQGLVAMLATDKGTGKRMIVIL